MNPVIVTDGEKAEVWEHYRKGEEIPQPKPQGPPQAQTAQGGKIPVPTPPVWPGSPDDWRD